MTCVNTALQGLAGYLETIFGCLASLLGRSLCHHEDIVTRVRVGPTGSVASVPEAPNRQVRANQNLQEETCCLKYS